MGNIDTKLNFRKAVVQLGTKNQVIYPTTKVKSSQNLVSVNAHTRIRNDIKWKRMLFLLQEEKPYCSSHIVVQQLIII